MAQAVLTAAIEGETAKSDLIKLVFKNTTWPVLSAPEPEPEPEPAALPMDSMSMEEAEGPEADAAWRALVAKHPEGAVIDDFMIALPAEGGEPEPETEAEAAEAARAARAARLGTGA